MGEAVTCKPAGEVGGLASVGPWLNRQLVLPLSVKVPPTAGRKVQSYLDACRVSLRTPKVLESWTWLPVLKPAGNRLKLRPPVPTTISRIPFGSTTGCSAPALSVVTTFPS